MMWKRSSGWLFGFLVISAMLLFTPPMVKISACLVFGLTLGLLSKKTSSPTWAWPVGAAIGLLAANLSEIEYQLDDWRGLVTFIFLCTGSITITLLSYTLGSWLQPKIEARIRRWKAIRTIDQEFRMLSKAYPDALEYLTKK
ncbi:MAG TPA: hypothetical protein VMU07_03420 [Candidatus Paceibacterota bacterium]|nr:hypothetical protein [Candidatus Paceibacterota bacterium]